MVDMEVLPQQLCIKEGSGWRLGFNPQAENYQGLVASATWALELTQAEFQDFCRLALQLAGSVEKLASELMDEERFTCEAESSLLWLEAEGFPDAYSLRMLLLTGRGAEGSWPAAVVPHLIAAISGLAVF